MGTILAIDPGNTKSGYVIVEHDGEEIRRVLEAGKIENPAVTDMLDRKLYANCIDVAIEMIEESEQPAVADSYDYYYVPTFYVDGVKAHEGAASKEIVEKVLRSALA